MIAARESEGTEAHFLGRDVLWCGTPARQADEPLHFGQILSPAQELRKACRQLRQSRSLASMSSASSAALGFLILMRYSVSGRPGKNALAFPGPSSVTPRVEANLPCSRRDRSTETRFGPGPDERTYLTQTASHPPQMIPAVPIKTMPPTTPHKHVKICSQYIDVLLTIGLRP